VTDLPGDGELAEEQDADVRAMVLAVLVTVVVLVLRSALGPTFAAGRPRAWMTVFIAISVQAMPFLVLGVTLSALIAAFVSPAALARVLPRRRPAAVVVAGGAGFALPGCECGAVPVAGRLIGGGVPAAAALTFLLAAPAINPIVLAATATAFPGHPEVVLARFGASLATAIVVGLIWLRIGDDHDFTPLIERATRSRATGSRWARFADAAAHDLLHAGGWLVVGAAVAATIQVVVPTSVVDALGGLGIVSVIVLGLVAVVLCTCSEADAFVATSFTSFTPTARLAFMVVGPAVDLKLIALQVGTFGRRFARAFAPLTFAVAVACATIAGRFL